MIKIIKLKPTIIFSTVLLCAFGFVVAHKVFKVYSTSPTEATFSVSNEKRGKPAFEWVMAKDMLPHMKVFFWVPKNSNKYIPFTDKSVKYYISRHGPVNEWGIKSTGKTTKTEKEVYVWVPKSFVLLHGSDFYKLVHIQVEKK